MMESFGSLFEHPKWPDYQQALTDRHDQLQREIENWQAVPGADEGTNLADIASRLREMATLRWLRDEVPNLLTHSEKEVQRNQEEELGGGAYATELGEDRVAGEEAYDPDGPGEAVGLEG